MSIDEEVINIIQFQRAFEASSRVIRVTDELLQSLLQMV
jgi:flagellar hook-associated protein 1 FlgK